MIRSFGVSTGPQLAESYILNATMLVTRMPKHFSYEYEAIQNSGVFKAQVQERIGENSTLQLVS